MAIIKVQELQKSNVVEKSEADNQKKNTKPKSSANTTAVKKTITTTLAPKKDNSQRASTAVKSNLKRSLIVKSKK